MNPIFQWVVAHTAWKRRLRRCPRCGHEQLVRAGARDQAVACGKCAAPLPPPS